MVELRACGIVVPARRERCPDDARLWDGRVWLADRWARMDRGYVDGCRAGRVLFRLLRQVQTEERAVAARVLLGLGREDVVHLRSDETPLAPGVRFSDVWV